MNRWPWPNRIMLAALGVMSAVQICLAYQFWGSFSSGDGLSARVFQALGVALAVIEGVALMVSSKAASDNRPVAAYVLRTAFIGCFIANLVCDIGAAVTYIDRDAHARADTAAAFATAKDREAEISAKIDGLHSVLAKDGLDQAPEALRVQLEAEKGIVRRTEIDSPSRAYRERRVAKLQSALTNAGEIERLAKEREAFRVQTDGRAAPPEAHPEILTLEAILSWFGVTATSEEVQRGIAIGIAVVVRLLLAIGYWVAIPSTVERGAKGMDDQPERAPRRTGWPSNIIDAARRFVLKRTSPDAVRPSSSIDASPDDNEPPQPASVDFTPESAPSREWSMPKPRFKGRSPEVPSAGIHVIRSAHDGSLKEIDGGDGKRETRTRRTRRHSARTCPTCKTPLSIGDHHHDRLDALDDLDPVR
ncbi:MAG: hypothetical protein GC204_03800 [Chloroflexi bacterium]|nr:hypothetical protein [Chloroflexota bacterium]